MKKVVIVGAGPAGLFAAWELADSFDVLVLDKEKQVGGAGLVSDGKLNLHPRVGGDLTKFFERNAWKRSWELIERIDEVFSGYGVREVYGYDEEKLNELEKKARACGMSFTFYRTKHIGTDFLPKVMKKFKIDLEKMGVEFRLGVRVSDLILNKGKVLALQTTEEAVEGDYFVLAPGRKGVGWVQEICKKLGLRTSFNPVDIGVRVEVPNSVAKELVEELGCLDPKFSWSTKKHDDPVRTFCFCYRGFVFLEDYGNGMFGVNGYSMRKGKSPNTNFAFLVTVALTQPLENTTDYGQHIVRLTNRLGGGKPIVQRLQDLRKGRRSTWKRMKKNPVKPSLKDVTPGDIGMAYPSRILTDVLEGLETLDSVLPGVFEGSTLLYAPEVKFYALEVETDNELRTRIPNLWFAGDGSGKSRGIVCAAATGIIAARGIKRLGG